jgi:acyl-CoA synthetase (AMP-forming)/AMP-acid ligase II
MYACSGPAVWVGFVSSSMGCSNTEIIPAGIPFCPLPDIQHDLQRRSSLLSHLRRLFTDPVLIAPADMASDVRQHQHDFRVVDADSVASAAIDYDHEVYPALEVSSADPVALMLSSGSTGAAKAVVLRHSHLLSSCYGKVATHHTTSLTNFLNWISFDHVASLSEIHLHALLTGSR